MDNENKNPLTPEEESTPAQEAIEPAGPESPAAEIPAEETQTASEPDGTQGEAPAEETSTSSQDAADGEPPMQDEQEPSEALAPVPEADTEKPQKPKKPKKDSHKGKYRGISLAMTAGFLVVVILLNVVVSLLAERYPSMNLDLTEGHVNTLSDSAAEIASNVQNPTTIYIMASEDIAKSDTLLAEYGIKYSQVSALAEKMAERNSNISVEYIDLDQNPAFASEYQDDGLMTADVLVKTDKRYRVLAYTDLFDVQYSQTGMVAYSMVDSALASAVSSVNADTLPLAVFDTGHNEMMDTTLYKNLLTSNNFETQEINLLTDEIPENAQLFVLATPATDYTPDEIEKLEAFLTDESKASDRSLLVTFYPGQDALPNLTDFLKEWGLDVQQSTQVVETDPNSYITSDPSYLLANQSGDITLSRATSDYGYLLMPQSCPINLLFDERNGITTHTLATSSSSAFLYDGTEESISNPQTGEHTLAALAQKTITTGEGEATANVVALGSTFMFVDGIINSNTFGDGRYLTDLAKYVTGTEGETIAVETRQVQTSIADISMSLLQVMVFGLGIFTILIPLIVVVIGVVVYYRRRRL